MDISPEVSLHECLWAMGDVALAQADAEFHGDRKRAYTCVLAMINNAWAVLMQRGPGAAKPVPKEKVRHELHVAENWLGFDEKTARCFLRVTDLGAKAFITETNFFEKLSHERVPINRRPAQKRGKQKGKHK